MLRSELRALTQQYLDDLSGGYHTDSIVNSWLNLAQREAQKLLIESGENFYVTTSQTSTVANQQEYVLPSDFFIVNMLEIITGGTAPSETRYNLDPITMNQQYLVPNLTVGQPKWYFLKRNTMILVPTPNVAQILRMNYHYRVADMTLDSQTADVPEQYQELISILAAMRGFVRDDRGLQNLQTMKEEYIKQMKAASEERRVDAPRMIVQTHVDEVGIF